MTNLNLTREIFLLLCFQVVVQSKHLVGFPSTTFLINSENQPMGITDVKVGDVLRSISHEGKMQDDPVIAILVADDAKDEMFVQIKLMSGEVIEMKPKQLVYEFSEGRVTSSTFAKDLKPGNVLFSLHPNILNIVAQTKLVKKHGVYLPLTKSGTLFVNGVLVSCYGLMKSESVVKKLFDFYQKGTSYLPYFVKDWIDEFKIGKKHWLQYAIELILEFKGN